LAAGLVVPEPGRDAACGTAPPPFSRGARPCSRPLGPRGCRRVLLDSMLRLRPLPSSAIGPPAARPVAAAGAACVRGRRRGGARGAAALDDALQQHLGCA